MINSKGSVMVVGDQGAHDWLAGVVVVPDGCGEGEDALQDPGGHSGGGAPAVAFEVELAFEGGVDRFDDLPQRLEELGAGAGGLAVAGGAQQPCAAAGEGVLKAGAVVVLIPDDGLAGPARGQLRVVEDVQQYLPLVGLGAGQREPHRQAVQRAQQVQPQPPEPAGVAGAVPVFGPSGQVRALDGLPGAAAFDRGGVDHPYVVMPQAGAGGQGPDQPAHGGGQLTQPLVVPGLAGHV